MNLDVKTMTREIRLTRWSEIMRERRDSGKSVRTWCEDNGVKEKTYYYWQRRLRKSACEMIASSQSTLYQSGMPLQSFAEIKLEPPTDRQHLEMPVSHICIELGKVRITAGSAYSPEKMALLLKELLRPC